MRRNKIVQRKKTHQIQKIKENYSEKIKDYFEKLENIKKIHGDNIIYLNMDETPIYYDMGKDVTLNLKSQKQINILTHTGAKHRVSVCPTITSNGEILSILVVFLYRYLPKKKNGGVICPKKFLTKINDTYPTMVRFNKTGFNMSHCYWSGLTKSSLYTMLAIK